MTTVDTHPEPLSRDEQLDLFFGSHVMRPDLGAGLLMRASLLDAVEIPRGVTGDFDDPNSFLGYREVLITGRQALVDVTHDAEFDQEAEGFVTPIRDKDSIFGLVRPLFGGDRALELGFTLMHNPGPRLTALRNEVRKDFWGSGLGERREELSERVNASIGQAAAELRDDGSTSLVAAIERITNQFSQDVVGLGDLSPDPARAKQFIQFAFGVRGYAERLGIELPDDMTETIGFMHDLIVSIATYIKNPPPEQDRTGLLGRTVTRMQKEGYRPSLDENDPELVRRIDETLQNPDSLQILGITREEHEQLGINADTLDILGRALLNLIAANDTTVGNTVEGTLMLAKHPDQWQRLVDVAPNGSVDQDGKNLDRLALHAAMTMNRLATPVRMMQRAYIGQEPRIIGNVEINHGDAVQLLYPAANRDPRVFGDRPNDFVIGNELDGRAVSFGGWENKQTGRGSGPHNCLGQAAARLIMAETIAAMARHDLLSPIAGQSTERIEANVRRLPTPALLFFSQADLVAA